MPGHSSNLDLAQTSESTSISTEKQTKFYTFLLSKAEEDNLYRK